MRSSRCLGVQCVWCLHWSRVSSSETSVGRLREEACAQLHSVGWSADRNVPNLRFRVRPHCCWLFRSGDGLRAPRREHRNFRRGMVPPPFRYPDIVAGRQTIPNRMEDGDSSPSSALQWSICIGATRDVLNVRTSRQVRNKGCHEDHACGCRVFHDRTVQNCSYSACLVSSWSLSTASAGVLSPCKKDTSCPFTDVSVLSQWCDAVAEYILFDGNNNTPPSGVAQKTRDETSLTSSRRLVHQTAGVPPHWRDIRHTEAKSRNSTQHNRSKYARASVSRSPLPRRMEVGVVCSPKRSQPFALRQLAVVEGTTRCCR